VTTIKTEKLLTDAIDFHGKSAERIVRSYIKSHESADQYASNDFSFETLHGGFSGTPILRFNLENRSFVLRLFKPEIEESDKILQLQNARLAGELGIGPKVLFADPKMEGFIMDFIPGRTVTNEDFKSEENLEKLALLLNKLHGSQQSLSFAKHPIQMFYRFIENGKKRSTPYPSQINEVIRIMQGIEIALKRNTVTFVPCHLDVNSQNLMLHENEFLLIDWEVGGLSDLYFDLSMFSVFLRLNESLERIFLEIYFKRIPSKQEWYRYIVSQPICLFLRAAVFLSKPGEHKSAEYFDNTISKHEVPSFSELIQLHQESRLHLPRWMIGLGMMQGGIYLVKSDRYQEAIQKIHNDK